MAAAEPQEALDALLRASASGALERYGCASALRFAVLSRARGVGASFSISFDADSVQFADGARFPRDTMLTTSVDQPHRLDVLCFLAQFALRNPGVVNAVAYVKARARSRVCACALLFASHAACCCRNARAQEARSAGVATVGIADRTRVLAYLATAETEGAPNAKRPRHAAAAGAPHPVDRGFDDFLPVPEDLRLRDCAQLNDRNSILLSRTKVRSATARPLRCA